MFFIGFLESTSLTNALLFGILLILVLSCGGDYDE